MCALKAAVLDLNPLGDPVLELLLARGGQHTLPVTVVEGVLGNVPAGSCPDGQVAVVVIAVVAVEQGFGSLCIWEVRRLHLVVLGLFIALAVLVGALVHNVSSLRCARFDLEAVAPATPFGGSAPVKELSPCGSVADTFHSGDGDVHLPCVKLSDEAPLGFFPCFVKRVGGNSHFLTGHRLYGIIACQNVLHGDNPYHIQKHGSCRFLATHRYE